jgi:hypothetical protein
MVCPVFLSDHISELLVIFPFCFLTSKNDSGILGRVPSSEMHFKIVTQGLEMWYSGTVLA